MHEKIIVSKKEIEQAKAIPIRDIAELMGFHLKKVGRHYRSVEHPSLEIVEKNNYFRWFSQGISGDSIQLVQKVSNFSFPQAVKWINENFERTDIKTIEYKEEPKQPFKFYMKRLDMYHKESINYLVNTRGLSKRLVENLLLHELIIPVHTWDFIANKNTDQIAFAWKKNGKIVGASTKGLESNSEIYGKSGSFRQIIKNSEREWAFQYSIGHPMEIYFFESAIDAMSYHTLHPKINNALIVSLEGLKKSSMDNILKEFIPQYKSKPKKIYLGFDNDPAGHKLFDQYSPFQVENIIPFDNFIPQQFVSIYKDAAALYGVDWKMIAAIHKSFGNFTFEVANSQNLKTFFVASPQETLDLYEESKRVAEALKEGGMNIEATIKMRGGDIHEADLISISSKVLYYYEQYQREIQIAEKIPKDWNEVLKFEKGRQVMNQISTSLDHLDKTNDQENALTNFIKENKNKMVIGQETISLAQFEFRDHYFNGWLDKTYSTLLNEANKGLNLDVLDNFFTIKNDKISFKNLESLQIYMKENSIELSNFTFQDFQNAMKNMGEKFAEIKNNELSITQFSSIIRNNLQSKKAQVGLKSVDLSKPKLSAADLLNYCEQGIKDVLQSDKYKEFLNTIAKFHKYSWRNIRLIQQQCPGATLVAGYKTWPKEFERHVKKGQKAIRIIGISKQQITQVEKEFLNGKEIDVEKKRTVNKYIPMYVFDISQTYGKEISLTDELTGNVKNYKEIYAAIDQISPFPIRFEEIQTGAKGYCDFTEKAIVIKKNMSQEQAIKTLIHEVTHAQFHENRISDTHTIEVEAESCAFIICAKYGIDTSQYSFPYLASWSSKNLQEIKNSFNIIQKQSHELIEKIDKALLELSKDKVTNLEQKINEAKEKSQEMDVEWESKKQVPSFRNNQVADQKQENFL